MDKGNRGNSLNHNVLPEKGICKMQEFKMGKKGINTCFRLCKAENSRLSNQRVFSEK